MAEYKRPTFKWGLWLIGLGLAAILGFAAWVNSLGLDWVRG